MSYKVDFRDVSNKGLETSPVSEQLAGLRADEAQYFWNKYKQEFITMQADEHPEILNRIEMILKERNIEFSYKPIEVSDFAVNGIRWSYVFYENGLSVSILYSLNKNGKREVDLKLASGMDIPKELIGKFRFITKESKLAGMIRESYFVITGQY